MLLAVITLASIGKVLVFLIMLSILVVLHEGGHFWIARRNGVRVNEFAIGMGPKIYGWMSPRSGTLYSVRALPIGGYCAMEGEDNKTSEADQQREFQQQAGTASGEGNFQSKTAWQRLAIVLAGPVANFILCYVILLIGALTFGLPSSTPIAVVGLVTDHSPAKAAGLQAGDRIVSIDGKVLADGNAVVAVLHASKGKALRLVYSRGGEDHTVRITPAACPAAQGAGTGCIGIAPASQYVRTSPLEAVVASGENFYAIADQSVSSIGALVLHFTQYAPQMSSVIGMGQAAQTIQDFGWGPYMMFAATISFALGLFNLLPLPALDGGRAAFIIAELIRRKPVDPEREAIVHITGLAALMVLMVVMAVHDIAKIVSGKGMF